MVEFSKSGYSSGQLARDAGVSTDTLRHYERRGLITKPKRLPNGYRCYAPETLTRVRLIQRALSVGFTLEELSRLLRARDRGQPPCGEVRALAERKLREVDARLEEIISFRDTLCETLRDWDTRLSKRKGNEPAHLLESLTLRPGEIGSTLKGARFDRRFRRREEK